MQAIKQLGMFSMLALLLTILVAPMYSYIIKEDESFLQQPQYSSQEQIEDLFARLEKVYPDQARVHIIGRSLEGRNLLALQIGRTTRQRGLLVPPVKYIGNMHGDETVGRQLLVYLAQYLLANYDRSLEVSQLVNSTDIYLMPTMNPDGYALSQEGSCESLPNYVGRGNAAGVDLNRDFPDRLEVPQLNQLRASTRQPETAALAEWIVSKPFVLSANFHGGAVVASYPYDNSIAHNECCEESLTPDDRVFKQLAHTYADNHPIMRRGNNCNDSFAGGITNGANWYELTGGMQDFNYAFTNCFELTIELSCCKFPPASTLPEEWTRNKHPLLELLKQAHIGIKGLVQDVGGYPIADATIVVSGLEDKAIRTSKRGEYWRLLTPGIYSVYAAAFGYQSSAPQQIHVTNDNAEALRLDFKLSPIETNYDGAFRKLKVERAEPASEREQMYDGFLTPTKFEHHNYTAMESFLRNINASYPSITRLYSIGKSVQNRDLWVMEIFATPGSHVPGVPEFKYVANMHGNEVVGREMLLLLTKYLCERYGSDERISRLVNSTRMHFLYSMNPDGYEISHEGDRTSGLGRANAHNMDLNRNFPDQYGTDKFNRVTEPEVEAVMNWTLSLPFVLSANLHGGSLVANYPFDDNENDFNDPYSRLRDATVGHKLNPTEDQELFKHLAMVYSEAHPTMHLGNPCELFQNEIFKDGITNGAQWYSVTGGMQDWNYVRAGCLELTIEMGCDKFPKAADLPKYWHDHREPLLKFIEQVHHGVHGFVRSSIGSPIAGAIVRLDDANHTTYSGLYGDYWKLALPGRHNVTVLADNFAPQRVEVEVPDKEPFSMRLDVTLMRDDPQHWASANDYRIIENVVNTRYHSDSEIRGRFAEVENQMGQIASFGYADNEFSQYFNYLKLTEDLGAPEEHKYKILILSSMFDTSAPLAREIMLNLVRHLIEGYKLRESWVLQLLQQSVLYFLPQTEKFADVFAMYNANNSICDPVLPDELADRVLGPKSDQASDMLLNFLKFDLMLTFSAGSSELSYPKGEPILEKFAHSIERTEFNYFPKQCAVTATRQLHQESTERLTNLFYKHYNLPMFTLGLSCCRMPPHTEIAQIWRTNIEKITNFLHLVETGVKGQVQNDKGQPLREAFVRLLEHHPVYNVTRNAAHFQMILPKGLYGLEVSAPNYESQVVKADIVHGHILDIGIVKLHPYTLIRGEVSEVHSKQTQHLGVGTTRVSGVVLDTGNHPIRNAKVSVISPTAFSNVRNFTNSMGVYHLAAVPLGDVTLKVEAPRHFEATRELHLAEAGQPTENVVFHLKFNGHVFGLPRIVFIIIASVLIIAGVVVCVLCAQFWFYRRHRGNKPYYNFSLLPQKGKEQFELDDDAGDDGETELFRSPIKRGMTIQPYFDEDQLEHILNSDDDADEDDERGDREDDQHYDVDESGDEIVMLHNHGKKRRH
ncbi:carboxypeptidase D isoform X2 [Scaptodrosophila lebanonensis]|uniref:Carboxypeptidase D isoform X2 n=1 Tax=Drosophila lebanonensis TaxID=7225 RepID=A0A6J2TU08_DROLE|nr:carboxypeptidase D isoform X2 [Scaptodrosophila lebanonensis]